MISFRNEKKCIGAIDFYISFESENFEKLYTRVISVFQSFIIQGK